MSSTMVACQIPKRDSGIASVSVSNDGRTFESLGMNLEFIGAGGVSSVNPSYGPRTGGSRVTVMGSQISSFNGTVQCMFGVQAVWAKEMHENEVVCSVPKSDTAGDVEILLVSNGARVPGAVVYRYLEDAEVWSVLPSQGQMTGKTLVSVAGVGFVKAGLQCRFGVQSVTGTGVHLNSSTLVMCISPAVQEEGRVAVEISVTNGIGFTNDGVQFMYEQGARAEAVRPTAVKSETAGQLVTVFGQNFWQSAGLSCTFGLNPGVQAVFLSSTAVKCQVPAKGPGVVKLSVSNNGIDRGVVQTWLQYSSPGSGGVARVLPSSGPVEGGTRVQLVQGRAYEDAVMGCRFGESHVVAERGPDGAVYCESPYKGTSGVVTFQWTLWEDRLVSGEELQYEYVRESAVQRMRPERGALTGGTLVSLYGTGFAADSEVQCRFGGQHVAGRGVSVVSSTLIHCSAPASQSPGEVMVEVSMNGGSDFTRSGKKFVYAPAATATGLLPSMGRSGPGAQVVTVVGRNFEDTSELRCQIGLVQASIARYISTSTAICALPTRGAGTVTVSVSNNGVDFDVGVRFKYLTVPKVMSIVPSMGPTLGGGTVTMYGTGLGQYDGGVKCMFGQDQTVAQKLNASAVLCVVPSAGSAGVVSAGLSGKDGALTDNSQYQYYEDPTIESI